MIGSAVDLMFNEREAITDVKRLKQSLFVIALVVLGFLFAHALHCQLLRLFSVSVNGGIGL